MWGVCGLIASSFCSLKAHLVLLVLLAENFHLLAQRTHLVTVLHRGVPDLPGFGCIPVRRQVILSHKDCCREDFDVQPVSAVLQPAVLCCISMHQQPQIDCKHAELEVQASTTACENKQDTKQSDVVRPSPVDM